MHLCQILVARQGPAGHIGTGTFLLDLGCLGLKSGFLSLFCSADEYRSALRSRFVDQQEMIDCDITLAAKVLAEAVRYARQLGFEPDRDGRKALKVLGGADPGACPEPVPLGGEDGRPSYFASPNDNVSRVMATLERSVGRDGFTFVTPAHFLD